MKRIKIRFLTALILAHSVLVSQSPYLTFTKDTVPPAYHSDPASYSAQMIAKGAQVYQNIERGDVSQLQANLDQYMQSIIALMFYFYSKAVDKNQAFNNGAFVIQDLGFKVFNFLYTFVEKKWQPKDMYKEITIDVSGKRAYPRQSTHLNDYYLYTNKAEKGWISPKKQKDFTHYGIDLPKEYRMPANKKHILFAKVETNPALTYIKLEDHGLGISGVVQHALGLAKSKSRKLVTKAKNKFGKLGFKEEAHLEKLLNAMANVLGSDDSADSRRERVPADEMATFLALLLSPGSPVAKDQIDTKRVKALGIQAMVFLLDGFIKDANGSAAWKEEARKFLQELRSTYDHVDIRIGREVILTPEKELRSVN